MAERNISKNKLVTVELKAEDCDPIKPVCLMGLVYVEERDPLSIEGWFLLISGNPLIPLLAGENPQNKIAIKRLFLTPDQEKCLLQNSFSQDGYSYLYSGMFNIENLKNSEIFSWEMISSNILNILSGHLSNNFFEIDVGSVVPVKERDMIRRVNKPKKEIIVKGNQQDGVEADEKKATLRFHCAGNQVLVKLEGPINHTGYHVGIILFETLIYSRDVKDTKVRSTTRILTETDALIPPCLITHGSENTTTDGANIVGKMVTLTIKKFQMPVFSRDWEQKFVKERKVCCVEYNGVAHLIRDGEWEETTAEKLMVKQFPRWVSAKQKVGIKEKTNLESSSELPPKMKGNEEKAAAQSDLDEVNKDSSLEMCPDCKISTRVVVMEVALKPGKREVERAFSF